MSQDWPAEYTGLIVKDSHIYAARLIGSSDGALTEALPRVRHAVMAGRQAQVQLPDPVLVCVEPSYLLGEHPAAGSGHYAGAASGVEQVSCTFDGLLSQAAGHCSA